MVEKLAKSYQLNGANIFNIISDVLIAAVEEDQTEINFAMLEPFMKKEFLKKGANMQAVTDDVAAKNPQHRFGSRNLYRRDF